MRGTQAEEEGSKREENLKNIQKWEHFKVQRALVVDLYLELKKRQQYSKMMVVWAKLATIIRKSVETFEAYRLARRKMQRQVFSMFILKLQWHGLLRRHGGSCTGDHKTIKIILECKQHAAIRSALTFTQGILLAKVQIRCDYYAGYLDRRFQEDEEKERALQGYDGA